jgi:hypothetical protein
MRWLSTALVLGLCLLGCGLAPAPIALLTGVDGCYAGGEGGVAGSLLVDSEYGTSLDGKPVMWPVGFTAVPVGREVQVLDSAGHVVATTGREYFISIGYVGSQEKQRLIESIGGITAAANCATHRTSSTVARLPHSNVRPPTGSVGARRLEHATRPSAVRTWLDLADDPVRKPFLRAHQMAESRT